MNRRPQTRLAALLVAVLFLLSGAESAFGVHQCPHHDLIVESGDVHAGHDMAGHEGMGHHSDPQPDHSGPCTCQGACQMGSAAALPELAATAPDAATILVEVPTLRGGEFPARHHTPFFLPYSQAPPRVG